MLPDTGDIVEEHILGCLSKAPRRPLIAGICGAQGSGKSWLVAALAERLEKAGLSVCALSLDDLYLTRAERTDLAGAVHPLLAVRGVPGTHDVGRGLELLDALGRQGSTAIPSFDKAANDRSPRSAWADVTTPVDIVLLEGWCVGAVPQADAALAAPINELEAKEDVDGHWRRYANEALSGPYQRLFGQIDTLVLLQAPSFDIVARWRTEQEETLRNELLRTGKPTHGLMDAHAVKRFISHYERLTRHILAEMPDRADLVIPLDEQRRPIG